MMRRAGDGEAQWLADARQALDEANRCLLAPDAQSLEVATEQLATAAAGLERLAAAWREQVPANPTAPRAHMAELRQQLAQLRLLLEQVGNFQEGWARLLGTMLGGYTRQGAPAALPTPPAVSLEG